MASGQDENDLVAVALRQGKFAGVAETLEFVMRRGYLFQRRFEGLPRIIVVAVEAVELGDRLD